MLNTNDLRHYTGIGTGYTPEKMLALAADEIEKLRGGLENTNVALRDARSIVVACRGSVKTDLNAYERLLIAKKKHNEQQTPTYIAAEAEAQRLFDLLAKIDALALTTPNVK